MTNYRGFQIGAGYKENIEAARSWGANLIRWQITGNMTDISNWDRATYDAWLMKELSHLQDAIPTIKANDMKVIVDIHHPVGGIVIDKKGRTVYRLFRESWARTAWLEHWLYIAGLFKSEGTVLAYDLLNEPQVNRNRRWNKLARKLLPRIREIDPNKPIIISSRGDDPRDIKGLRYRRRYGPIWYQVHMYLPKVTTFQGLSPKYPIGPLYPGVHNKRDLREFLKPARDFQKKHNAHIYVGEFSCARWSGIPGNYNCARYIQDCIELFEEFGWDWSYHAWREADVWNPEHITTRSQMKAVLEKYFNRNW